MRSGHDACEPRSSSRRYRSTSSRSARKHYIAPHPLHDLHSLAERGDGGEEAVQRAVGNDLVLATQRGDDALADCAATPAGLEGLQVFVRVTVSNATFHPDQHAGNASLQEDIIKPCVGTTVRAQLVSAACNCNSLLLSSRPRGPRSELSKISEMCPGVALQEDGPKRSQDSGIRP